MFVFSASVTTKALCGLGVMGWKKVRYEKMKIHAKWRAPILGKMRGLFGYREPGVIYIYIKKNKKPMELFWTELCKRLELDARCPKAKTTFRFRQKIWLFPKGKNALKRGFLNSLRNSPTIDPYRAQQHKSKLGRSYTCRLHNCTVAGSQGSVLNGINGKNSEDRYILRITYYIKWRVWALFFFFLWHKNIFWKHAYLLTSGL